MNAGSDSKKTADMLTVVAVKIDGRIRVYLDSCSRRHLRNRSLQSGVDYQVVVFINSSEVLGDSQLFSSCLKGHFSLAPVFPLAG